MNLINFIIYFNKKTGKIESVYDFFAKETNGKTEVFHFGHSYLEDKLKRKGISDYIMKGTFVEGDTPNNTCMYNLKYKKAVVDNNMLYNLSLKNNTSVIKERQYMSKVIIDFVKGIVSEDHFKIFLGKRIYNHDISKIPDIYNQKTK